MNFHVANSSNNRPFLDMRYLRNRSDLSRHVKINGSPVSLTENSAVFAQSGFLKKFRIFKNPLIVLPFFFFVKSHFL